MISMPWFKIISHDYMDMYPEVSYRQFENEEKANAFVKHMQENYHSGTTNYGGPATQEEIIKYCEKYNITLEGKLKEDVMNPLNYIKK